MMWLLTPDAAGTHSDALLVPRVTLLLQSDEVSANLAWPPLGGPMASHKLCLEDTSLSSALDKSSFLSPRP